MNPTPKMGARKRPSVPLMLNQYVLLLWSTPGKHLKDTDMQKMGYTATQKSTEFAWSERTTQAENPHRTAHQLGTKCQVCGRLKFQETAIIQQDQHARTQGIDLQLGWCI